MRTATDRGPPRRLEMSPRIGEGKNFIEFVRCHATTRWRLRRAGVATGLSDAAAEPIERHVNALKKSGLQVPNERLKDLIARPGSVAILNATAADRVWPIYWSVLGSERRVRYSKATARDDIAEFRSRLSLSRQDWKWLCAKDHHYLRYLFETAGPYNLYLPQFAIRDLRMMVDVPGTEEYLHPWLRRQFQQGLEVSAVEFELTLRDLSDAVRNVGPDLMQRLCRQTAWNSFVSALRSVEARDPQIYRLYGVRTACSYRDFVIGMNEAPDRGPPATEKISWLDPVQSTITHAGFTAHLLNDTLKIFNEGRGMEHCLYRSYMSKITSGHYVAFHIDAPHLNEFGFTCGIRFQEQTDSINGRPVWEAVVPTLSWFDFSADTPANPPSITKRLRGNWAVDQVRGKRNSIPEDPQLLGFAEDLATMLNETIQGHQPSTWKRVDRARPVQEFWRTITAEGLHDRHT